MAGQLPSLGRKKIKPVMLPATLQNPVYPLRRLHKNEDERGYTAWRAGGRDGKLEIGGHLSMVQETGDPSPDTYHGTVRGFHRLGLSQSSVWVEFPAQAPNKKPNDIPVLASNDCIRFPLTLRILMMVLSFFLLWRKGKPNSSDRITDAEEGRAPFLKVSDSSFGNQEWRFTVIAGSRNRTSPERISTLPPRVRRTSSPRSIITSACRGPLSDFPDFRSMCSYSFRR